MKNGENASNFKIPKKKSDSSAPAITADMKTDKAYIAAFIIDIMKQANIDTDQD